MKRLLWIVLYPLKLAIFPFGYLFVALDQGSPNWDKWPVWAKRHVTNLFVPGIDFDAP